jgi:hemin uptake protein HemP
MLVVHPHAHVPSRVVEHHTVEQRSSAAPDVLEIDSKRLLQGHRELYIRHGDECYRLRHTRNDKLILTK